MECETAKAKSNEGRHNGQLLDGSLNFMPQLEEHELRCWQQLLTGFAILLSLNVR